MTLYIRMPSRLKPHFQEELNRAKFEFAHDRAKSWRHLERAHVIGQPYPVAHTLVHWKMLKFGVRIKSPREVIGQLTRLIFGGVKSFVGHIPHGNTGGANADAPVHAHT